MIDPSTLTVAKIPLNFTVYNPDRVKVLVIDRSGIWVNPDVEPDEAARVFVESVQRRLAAWTDDIRDEVLEECAVICDARAKLWYDEGGSAGDCAYEIRERKRK